MLSIIIFLPLLASLLVLVFSKEQEKLIKQVSFFTTLIIFILTIVLGFNFDFSSGSLQNEYYVSVPWIQSLHINYTLGIDGISYPMVFLNALLFLICMVSSWKVEKNIKAYFSLLLLLQSSIFGVFLSLDFFLFYIFWEVMLIPMFFLIAIWGGENREYAATKFILYTFFGSILMLVGIIALYFVSGQTQDSFSIVSMYGGKFSNITFNVFGSTFSFENFFFWMLFLGFAIKVPIFPFHTWLPHAHVQAPTAVSVILAGVLLKMGTYGFIRIAFPIFPHAAQTYSYVIAVLGIISIVHGAFCALAQTDVKKLVAYSSVSHMGFVMLGLSSFTPASVNGAVMQMFNHGTSTAMMFLLIGIIYDRSHHRWIVKPDGSRGFSGLAIAMPVYTIIFMIGMFASLGLPGLSGFVSELLIFMGSFQTFEGLTILASIGLFFGAAYLLWMYRRMFFGEVTEEVKHYSDMNFREVAYMLPLCLLVIYLGIFPAPLANVMKASVGLYLEQFIK